MTVEEAKEAAVKAAKNEWGKTFKLGDPEKGIPYREFEIKDLPYFDYVEFIQLAKPLITVAAGGINMRVDGGEIGVDFDPASLDYDQIISLCGKELPRMGYLICRQTDPKIKEMEVALLAHRPQKLIELVVLQVMHNKMIDEFASFFPRLTAMLQVLMPDVAKVQAPVDLQSTTEETLSS